MYPAVSVHQLAGMFHLIPSHAGFRVARRPMRRSAGSSPDKRRSYIKKVMILFSMLSRVLAQNTFKAYWPYKTEEMIFSVLSVAMQVEEIELRVYMM